MRNAKKSAKAHAQKRGAALHVERLQPVRLPDARTEAFCERCERGSLTLIDDPLEAKTLARIARAADTRGWK